MRRIMLLGIYLTSTACMGIVDSRPPDLEQASTLTLSAESSCQQAHSICSAWQDACATPISCNDSLDCQQKQNECGVNREFCKAHDSTTTCDAADKSSDESSCGDSICPVEVFSPSIVLAPNGNDSNDGSPAFPVRSLQRAWDLAKAGDVIGIHGGEYMVDSVTVISGGGTENAPITIAAYPGEKPVFDAQTMTATGYHEGWVLWLNNVSWLRIVGLEIRNGPMGGVVMEGNSNHNRLERIESHHNGRLAEFAGRGISLFGGGSYNEILNCDAHHNTNIGYEHADGFHVSLTGSGNVIRNNRAWNNADDGFDFFNTSHANNSKGGIYRIEGNWAWANGYDDAARPLGDGNGFKLGGQRPTTSGNTSGGHIVIRNVAFRNANTGFTENDANRSIDFLNNTAFDNGRYGFTSWTVAHRYINNLSYKNPDGIWDNASSSLQSANIWRDSTQLSDAVFVTLESSRIKGNRDAEGIIPTSDFLRPHRKSILEDSGNSTGDSFSGQAPDIGALESF